MNGFSINRWIGSATSSDARQFSTHSSRIKPNDSGGSQYWRTE